MKKFLIVISFLAFNMIIEAQIVSFSIETILADACGNPEGENEMVLLQTYQAININDLDFDWPNNSFLGWCVNPTTTTQINQIINSSCGLILEPPLGIVPANSKVIVVSSTNMLVNANSFANLTDTLYIIYQCAGNTSGHFSNSASSPRTLTVSYNGTNTTTQSVSYVGSQLIGGDGGAVSYDLNGNATYVNTGCSAPVPSIYPHWDFPKKICSSFEKLDLNNFLNIGTTTNGTWSGDIVNNHYFDPQNNTGSFSITYTVADPNACLPYTDSTINFTVVNPQFGPDTIIVCDSIKPYSTWLKNDTTIYVTLSSNQEYLCDSTIVRFYDINKANFSLTENDVNINSGETYEFDIVGQGNYTYSYQSDLNDVCISPCLNTTLNVQNSDVYTINVIDVENTCQVNLDLKINLLYHPKLFIPNIFTPNNDGENDFFKIYGEDIKDVQIFIYSKWGELLFKANDFKVSWNGNFNNLPVENGIYLVQIFAIGKDEKSFKKSVNLRLIR